MSNDNNVPNHNAAKTYGDLVFSDAVMRERLPKDIYKALRSTMQQGTKLDPSVAAVVANAMKDWAVEKGVSHFTHWFQPMTGITAEKHDSFLTPTADGKAIMEFSGKELVQGEPDASSFPSGGLRATFEARGYTAWDATSFAFIKEGVLCIPTAFCSYGGEALDKKTPLLRSMQTINQQALRVLRLFGNTEATVVRPTVGGEQEYFLVDKEMFDKRPDLIFCGRTLIGAKPPKGQEMDDHYFGALKTRILDFMKDLDDQLWRLGIPAKTEHNEVAPAQHELAPLFSTVNVAVDQNQLTMELMQKIAKRHGLCCLLHEKPFAGVNGSGKHNNWSLSTDTGANLLDPGNTPGENAQFLLILCAVLAAVDEYQDMLRISVASAGNDHRLGANEAPPAVLSVFMGDELTAVLEAVEQGAIYAGKERQPLKIGVHTLPHFPKDLTDRNRTSPFAFTGNKFEFRMPGSSMSLAGINVVLNTVVAEQLRRYADVLEQAADFQGALHDLIQKEVHNHKRIIFNGNGYDEAWLQEAEKRGLSNLRTTPDCLPRFLDRKNVELFTSLGVFSEEEIDSRYEILMENYCKVINIEALTLVSMVTRDILPAVSRYGGELGSILNSKKEYVRADGCVYEKQTLKRLGALTDECYSRVEELQQVLLQTAGSTDVGNLALFYRDRVFVLMNELRQTVDELETITASDCWPYPTYAELLFGVR